MRPSRLLALPLVAWGAWIALRATFPAPPELRFLSVGQGDCALYRDSGVSVLVDAGPRSSSYDAGQRLVLPRLRQLGVQSLDLIVITHPDVDHVGGLPSLWRRFPEARVAANIAFREDPAMLGFLREAGRQPDDVVWIRRHSQLAWGATRMDIWAPEPIPGGSDNEGSLFVRIKTGASKAVLSGDAPMPVEEQMLPEDDFSSQVCNAGHHGSAGSLSPAWMAELRPKYVVASCGRQNLFGHPSVEAQERATSRGATFLRTDRDGEIRFGATPDGFVRSQP